MEAVTAALTKNPSQTKSVVHSAGRFWVFLTKQRFPCTHQPSEKKLCTGEKLSFSLNQVMYTAGSQQR